MVSLHHIQQQRLIGVDLITAQATIAGVQLGGVGADLQPGLFHLQLDAQTLHGLDAEQNPVGLQLFDTGLAKQLLGRILEADGNHRAVFGHAFPGAQVEGDAAPAPVVDVQFQRGVGFRGAVFRDAFFLQITWYLLAIHHPAAVLRPIGVGIDRISGDGTDRFQRLDLLVAQGLRIQIGGWLHRHQRQHLQQMALHHVPQCAGAIVVVGAAGDPQALGMGDLDVVDVVAVPERLQHQVGETEYQYVLHHRLPEVVVDPIDLLFRKVTVQAAIEDLRTLQVVAKRLFHHQAAPAPFLLVESGGREVASGGLVVGRTDGHVEGDVPG